MDGPEEIHALHDPGIGLHAFIVIASTRRGPAFGGIRRRRYASPAAALADARALATAMRDKCAIADLPAGGAKTVLIDDGDPRRDWRPCYRALGRAIEALGGRYVCGPDVGTTAAHLAAVRETTRHCNPPANDPGRATAEGVLAAIRAVWQVLDRPRTHRRSAAVAGLGDVGARVARALHDEGVAVAAADPLAEARSRAGSLDFVDPEHLLDRHDDVLIPCALGSAIDAARAQRLGFAAVCGSANNTLVAPADRILHARGIVVVPDVISSAGAVIEGVMTVGHGDGDTVRAEIVRRIAAIEITAARVLAAATGTTTPAMVAEALARERLHRG